MTRAARTESGAKAQGRFGKQDFAYLPEKDVYRRPSGELKVWMK
jgi:hypothetical protein